jgi:HSP20 family protein
MSTYLPAVISSTKSNAFDRQIDRMFEEALRAWDAPVKTWVPACNVWEDEEAFYVQTALPGWDPKDIVLEVNSQVMTVKGERKKEETEMSQRYHLREIGDGQFTRLFKLPTFVHQDKASATHKNGLLTVAFPKREEAKCRRIAIESR